MRPTACLLLLLPPAIAGEKLDLPLRHLELRKDVTFSEGRRSLRDAFPYVEMRDPHWRVEQLAPKNFGRILAGPIDSEEAAVEAARMFVAGPLVRTTAEGEALITMARRLAAELEHLRTVVEAHRPPRWAPTATRTDKGWTVSFVACEMDNVLQLVHVTATVGRAGAVALKRAPIVRGPMTSWQSASLGDDDGPNNEAAMRAEARLARRRYAAALRPPRDLDTAWAIARLRLAPRDIEDLWPGRRRVVGSGRKIVAVDLEDGVAAVFDATDAARPIAYLRLRRDVQGPMKKGALVHTFAAPR